MYSTFESIFADEEYFKLEDNPRQSNPKKTWYFKRKSNGEVFATEAGEASRIFDHPGYELYGVSDGTKYLEKKAEAIKKQNEDIKALRDRFHELNNTEDISEQEYFREIKNLKELRQIIANEAKMNLRKSHTADKQAAKGNLERPPSHAGHVIGASGQAAQNIKNQINQFMA